MNSPLNKFFFNDHRKRLLSLCKQKREIMREKPKGLTFCSYVEVHHKEYFNTVQETIEQLALITEAMPEDKRRRLDSLKNSYYYLIGV